MRLAFVGFRHGHIMGLYDSAMRREDVEVVGACEEDSAARERLRSNGKVKVTHDRFAAMLVEIECDAIAIGDTFVRRGALAIAALQAGRHVLSDKPICTRLSELEQIQGEATARNLRVGCLLGLRKSGVFQRMRSAIGEGMIGEVHTVVFTAQHPLLPNARPQWYFEAGQQGGTINDIAVHAMDLIPWLTGRRISGVVAARTWNTRPDRRPHFEDAAQLMLRLDNGGGVIGDVSYLAPNKCGYRAPQYWRVTCHGDNGMIEATGDGQVLVATHEDDSPRGLPAVADIPNLSFDSFRRDITDESLPDDLTTAGVLTASRHALLAQQAARG